MKSLVLILSILFSTQVFGNKIDSIKTDEDAMKFILALLKKSSKTIYTNPSFKKPDSISGFLHCDSSIIEWGAKSWQKIDVNTDGLTDLFAILYNLDAENSHTASFAIYVIIDKGNNTFDLQELPGYFMFNCYTAKPIFIKGKPYILYRYYKTEYKIDSLPDAIPTAENYHYYEVDKTDTLVYKYGAFIEMNTKKPASTIKSFLLETTGCLGFCPIFKLNIFKDGAAYYETDISFDDKVGNFRTIIKPKELNKILNLINYLNLPDLDNSYEASGTDYPSATLTAFFSDGSMKRIYDYGQQGTLGLVYLYKLLFSLRENQNWK